MSVQMISRDEAAKMHAEAIEVIDRGEYKQALVMSDGAVCSMVWSGDGERALLVDGDFFDCLGV